MNKDIMYEQNAAKLYDNLNSFYFGGLEVKKFSLKMPNSLEMSHFYVKSLRKCKIFYKVFFVN